MPGGPAVFGGGIGTDEKVYILFPSLFSSLDALLTTALEPLGRYRHDGYVSLSNFSCFPPSYTVLAFSAFGGILFGYDTGVIGGVKVMDQWLETFGHPIGGGKFGISSSTESLVVSILSAGTFFGALLGAPSADILGRKWVWMTSKYE